MLTRDSDANLSLNARAGFARVVGADPFVSIHFNYAAQPGSDSTEVYVGRRSSDGDRALAVSLHQAVSEVLGTPSGGVLAADLGVVARNRQSERTSAVLIEVCDLSNPRRAAQLRDPATLDRLAAALAGSLTSRLALRLGQDPAVARVSAAKPRSFTGAERFVQVVARRYLPEYLAAPSQATAEAAIQRMGGRPRPAGRRGP